MARLNDKLHTALEHMSGKSFNKGETVAKTIANMNTAYIPVCAVSFSAKDSVSESAITGFALVVKKAGEIIAPKTEGGATYDLAVGEYTYTISKAGYATQSDVALTISSGDITTGTKAVVVSMVAAG